MSTAMRASESVHRPTPPVGTGYGPRDATRLGAVFRDAGRLAAPGFQDGRSTPGKRRRHAVSVPGFGNGPDARPAVCPAAGRSIDTVPPRADGEAIHPRQSTWISLPQQTGKGAGPPGNFRRHAEDRGAGGSVQPTQCRAPIDRRRRGTAGPNKESGEDAPPLSTEARDDLNPVAQGPIRCRRLRRLRDPRAEPR